MRLYRADPKDGVAWVTGGSSGLGRELARELAREGYTVAVTAREEDPIDTLVAETSDMRGRVLAYSCDVTDEKRMAATVAAIENDAGPIVLAVFNAGSYAPVSGDNLSVRRFRQLFDVNVIGVVHGLAPVVRRMRARVRGHVVLVGSISAYFGWPTTAAYGASKAALNVMAEALKYDFDKLNIRTQVINPGFIDTPLVHKVGYPLPALMPADDAARRMMRAIRSGGFEVTFPRRLTWCLKLLGILPEPLCRWFVESATGWKKRPMSFGRKPPGLT
jgi:NAD(P)-dependent dehydrogenase (short-subunit alcohol dehydrogenase family)